METYYTQTHGTINILSQSNLITTREAGPVVIATITICACALLYLDPPTVRIPRIIAVLTRCLMRNPNCES